MQLFSPAKINLFFRVLKKREDGYHEIASLYQAISLGDFLEITLSNKDQLVTDHPFLSVDSSNLVLKAAALFREKTALPLFAHFQLKKNIPMQAGLGGGSSNAATTLWGLNELAGRPASLDQLKKWAAELGSDVPFFLTRGTAYCTGRGEILEERAAIKGNCFIAKPVYASLATPLVYANTRPDLFPLRDPLTALASFDTQTALYFNDLETPSFQLAPSLADLKQQLFSLGFHTVVMTGSGTAFFCLGDLVAPSLPSVQFFATDFIFRNEDRWF